jgi:hypothetical protein
MNESSDLASAEERQREALRLFAGEYELALSDRMGSLHNQFVAFISASQIPLPQVLVVLEMLRLETLDQARQMYLKE